MLFRSSGTNENGYTVKVKISDAPADLSTDTLVLSSTFPYKAGDNIAIVKNGVCEFKGNVTTPDNYMLYFKGEGRPFCRFFLENESFEIDANLSNPSASVIEGGVTQKVMNTINKKAEEIYASFGLDSLMKEYRTATEEGKAKIESIYTEAMDKINSLSDEYIKQHPTSFYALNNLKENIEKIPSDKIGRAHV